MAKLKVQGNASGTGVVTLTAPNTNTDRTITLPDDTQTLIGTNASGNVGIGTTSPTDFTNRKSLDIGAGGKIWSHTSSVETGIGNNFYYTSGYKYLTTQVASKYNQDDNGHSFQVAPSGTADTAISWTTAMTITSDGRGLSSFTAKAWVNFNGTGTVAIRDSHNVSSITDNGTGDYSVSFSNSLSNTNYSVASSAKQDSVSMRELGVYSYSTGSFACSCNYQNNSKTDAQYLNAIVFGD